MMIDPTASMPLGQEADIKIRKKTDVEGLKPVEGSGDSGSAKLDLDKEDITTMEFSDSTNETGDIYDTKGQLVNKESLKNEEQHGNPTIDIIV